MFISSDHHQISPFFQDCRGKLFYCHLVPKRVPVSDSDRRSERVNVTHFCTVCPGSLHWLSQMAAFNVESTGEAWCILYNALHYIDGSLTKQGKQLCLGGERLVEEMGGGYARGSVKLSASWQPWDGQRAGAAVGDVLLRDTRWISMVRPQASRGKHWAFVPLIFVS